MEIRESVEFDCFSVDVPVVGKINFFSENFLWMQTRNLYTQKRIIWTQIANVNVPKTVTIALSGLRQSRTL